MRDNYSSHATIKRRPDIIVLLSLSLSFVLVQPIGYLNSTIFNALIDSNVSIKAFLFPDQTINLDGLSISHIEGNTFVNYPVPVTTIILSSNVLSYLPPHLFQPFSPTLIHLNLQRNEFHSLTKNYFLRRLDRLQTLDFSKNQLTQIFKQDFTGLRHLETLILRENKLTYLPYAVFSRCRTITSLDLSDNEISIIDSNAFRSLYRLKTLVLSNNPLGHYFLTNQLFMPLKNLEYLDLENAKLTQLRPFLFIFNSRLQSIKLRRNHFQTDTNENLQRTFCQAHSLVEIDLVSTQLRSLDVCTYDQIPSLRRLYLMNNPLHCSCDLFYLKYGDVYRVLLTDGNGLDRIHTDVDGYLDRWISRPELRRHLEKSQARGDFHRFPIELSLFARCATPKSWSGREIDNITGVFSQCQERWSIIEEQCQNYCQLETKTIFNSYNSSESLRIALLVLFFEFVFLFR